MPAVSDALDRHLAALAAAGAASAQVLVPARADPIAALDALAHVTLPEAFRTYLARVGSYDRERCHALGASEPEFAWGYFALDARHIPTHYRHAGPLYDEDGYWPYGLVPFLWGGSGDYVLLDGRADAATFGAVYELTEAEGVGERPLWPDLAAFLAAATDELATGRRVFETPSFSRLTGRGVM